MAEELEKQAQEEKKFDYKKVFTQQYDLMKRIKKVCPNMDHKSGIYFYIRTDEQGGKHCYVGKAVDLLKRTASHLRGWNQRIDGSLKKRGLYGEDNPYGWKLHFIYFSESELNQQEKYFIDKYRNAGYEMYNVESGGDVATEDIGERKPTRGYHDGLKQQKKNIQKQLFHWFETSLEVSIKGKPNKNKEKALNKFLDFIKGGQDGTEKNDTI